MNQLYKSVVDSIKEYNKIVIMRHERPDGDCIGASLGLREIIKNSFPEKEVKVIAKDFAYNLNFIDKEDEEENEEYYYDALIIVVDTANTKRISNDFFNKGKMIVKIDHHPNLEPYGDINVVEEELSSACELITKIYEDNTDSLVLTSKAATLLYMGIVTDSGRFRFSSVTGDTLRTASILLDKNIDVESLFSNLYLKDFEVFKLESAVYKKIKISKNGVAYVYLDKKMQEKFSIEPSEASMMVSSLDSIKGSLIWIAFIDMPDGSIRVRLRSRFLDINDIAQKYNGGGHNRASGATIYSINEMKRLIKEADLKLKKYKEENTGWL